MPSSIFTYYVCPMGKIWPWQTKRIARKDRLSNMPSDPRYRGARWRKYRATFFAISVDNNYCAHCARLGDTVPATILDHIVPVSKGGAFYPPFTGVQPLCFSCHQRKSAKEASR